MADQITTSITDKIRNLIESSREEVRLGTVQTTKPPQVFQFRDQIIQNSPDDFKQSKNIIWEKLTFQFDRGKYTDFQSTGKQKTAIGLSKTTTIVSNNGNFEDNDLLENTNIFYTCTINVPTEVIVPIKITAPDASIIIRHTSETDGISNVVYRSSLDSPYTQGSHNIVLSRGVNVIRVAFYRQAANGHIKIDGDLGSFISSFSSSISFTKSKPTVSSSTSKFIDSKISPALANILVVNRMDPEFDFIFSESDIIGFNIYRQNNVKLAFQTVSGFGDNGFAVNEDKLADFPLGGTIILPGPDTTEFIISGTEFDGSIDQTIVTVSGTLTASVASSDIYIGHLEKKIQAFQSSSNSLISGTDFDVVAGTTYKYFITAFDNQDNEGPLSDAISITAGDFTPPGQVTNLTAVGANKSIKLFWDNPSDQDLKGIHVWDRDNPVSGTDMPVQTLLKGSANTVPSGILIDLNTDGALVDDTAYTFYISTFDWAGNEDANGMPSATATTRIDIKTKQTGQRIETDTDTNQLRFYDSNDNEIIRIGEDIFSTRDGLVLNIDTTPGSAAVLRLGKRSFLLSEETFTGTNAVETSTISLTSTLSSTSLTNIVSNSLIFTRFNVNAEFDDSDQLFGIRSIMDNNLITVNHKMTALEAEYQGTEFHNTYSGRFLGAKVFIEKDLIVSGTKLSVSGTADFSGDVGIGTTIIGDTKFIVEDGDLTRKIGLGVHPNATTDPCLQISDSSGNLDRVLQRQISTNDIFIGDIDANSGSLIFRTNGVTQMTLDTDGSLGIGTTTPVRPLEVVRNTANTSVREVALAITATSSATTAAGWGAALEFYAEDDGGTVQEVAVIGGVYEDASAGAIDTALTFETRTNSGAFTEKLRIDNVGNLLLGTTTNPAGTNGKVMVFGDNGGDPTVGTDTAGFFAKDVAGTTTMHVIDEADTVTVISPHDPITREWIFFSKNIRTGKVFKVKMEQMMRKLNDMLGGNFIEEYIEPIE